MNQPRHSAPPTSTADWEDALAQIERLKRLLSARKHSLPQTAEHRDPGVDSIADDLHRQILVQKARLYASPATPELTPAQANLSQASAVAQRLPRTAAAGFNPKLSLPEPGLPTYWVPDANGQPSNTVRPIPEDPLNGFMSGAIPGVTAPRDPNSPPHAPPHAPSGVICRTPTAPGGK